MIICRFWGLAEPPSTDDHEWSDRVLRQCDTDRVNASAELELDPVSAGAIELARAAAVDVAGADAVGEHLGVRADAELVVTHAFATTMAGYVGWHWAVTLDRAPDADPTVAEVVLLPGEGALLAPAWVPWSERLQPGDLSPGDLLPSAPDDPRLVPSYADYDGRSAEVDLTADPAEEIVAFEIGLGRERVLSLSGRLDAAERWYEGAAGPDTPMARQAPAHCGTCGFMVALSGSLRQGFGVCANEFAATDGRVVSMEFGCGAHSDVVAEPVLEEPTEVFDDDAIVEISLTAPGEELLQEPIVDAEGVSVEGEDGPDTAGVQAEDEASTTNLAELDVADLDRHEPVESTVEEPSPSDAG